MFMHLPALGVLARFCRSRYAGVGKRVRDQLEVKITHEVPAERQLIRQAGTMHLGWIWTGNLRSLLTGPGWSTAGGEPAVKSEAVNHEKRHRG